jgi:hypothetical protein
MMTGALLVRNSGSIAYLLAATFYKVVALVSRWVLRIEQELLTLANNLGSHIGLNGILLFYLLFSL